MSGYPLQRASVIEMMLLAYTVWIAGFVCSRMPVMAYGAVALIALALLFFGYGLWRLARPASPKAYLLFALSLAGILALTGVLDAFASEMAAFTATKQNYGVTPELLRQHNMHLLLLFALHTAASALLTLAFYAFLRPSKRALVPLFALSWAAMPILFLLMELYGVLFPAVLKTDMLLIFIGWLIAVGVIGYGTYQVTEGSRRYTAVFMALAFFAPPVGAAAFVIFALLQILKPAGKKQTDAKTSQRRSRS
jgi:hypothetical protein